MLERLNRSQALNGRFAGHQNIEFPFKGALQKLSFAAFAQALFLASSGPASTRLNSLHSKLTGAAVMRAWCLGEFAHVLVDQAHHEPAGSHQIGQGMFGNKEWKTRFVESQPLRFISA